MLQNKTNLNAVSVSSHTMIWTAGITPVDLIQESMFETNKGRILVNEFLQVPKFPEVFAIGDCSIFDPKSSMKKFPPTAQTAEAHAKTTALNLKQLLYGEKMSKFDYTWKGQSAIIGKRTGVASFFNFLSNLFYVYTILFYVCIILSSSMFVLSYLVLILCLYHEI